MIPKTIHYCWFGDKPLPPIAKKCIASWEKYCPEYQIIQWNERNYHTGTAPFSRYAYQKKQWAFLSDYARLDILYRHGGIYFDIDVELLKPIDSFLSCHAFCGMDSDAMVSTGLILGAEVHNEMIKIFRDDYDISVQQSKGEFVFAPCPVLQTKILQSMGFEKKQTIQTIHGLTIFPHDYFCPKDYRTGEIRLTQNSYTIHHFNASWLPWRLRTWMYLRDHFGKIPAFLFWNITKSPGEMWGSINRNLKK